VSITLLVPACCGRACGPGISLAPSPHQPRRHCPYQLTGFINADDLASGEFPGNPVPACQVLKCPPPRPG
jgi:hypothetical protein